MTDRSQYESARVRWSPVHAAPKAFGGLLLLGLLLTPGAARGDWLHSSGAYKWPGGAYTFLVNWTSFLNNFPAGTLQLSQTETEYWVANALSMWRERTGINTGLTFTYGGTTGETDNTCSDNETSNSEVYVVSGCRGGESAPCITWAEAGLSPWPPTNSAITEADVCIYGGSVGTAQVCTGRWHVRLSDLGAADKDLIGVLVHEFGHALGLAHVANTVMDSPTFSCGNSLARYPYGDDIDGGGANDSMRGLYPLGGNPVAYWRETTNGQSWGLETAVPAADGVWHIPAAVGNVGGGADQVVVGELADNGDVIAFNRANYPLSGGSSWTATYYGVDAWRPPTVAGVTQSYGELWVSGLARAQLNATSCPGFRVYRSTNAFATATSVDLGADNCGLMHEPTVTFDSSAGRFVLFFVRRTAFVSSSGVRKTGKIYARTSTDGTTWTSAQDLGIWTIDAVDIACEPDNCLMGYLKATSNSPVLVNQKFTVNPATGNITLYSSTQTTELQDRTPAVGVFTQGSSYDWLLARTQPRTTSVTDRANSTYELNNAESTVVPFSSFGWYNAISAVRRPSLAAVPEYGRMYLWYVK